MSRKRGSAGHPIPRGERASERVLHNDAAALVNALSVALLALVSWQDVEGAEGPDGADRRWTILPRREVHVADLGW
jgi:hypothetical protein